MDYPAITICGLGWIDEVLKTAQNNQFRNFVKKKLRVKRSVDVVSQLSPEVKKKYYEEYLNETFPGATGDPLALIKLLSSPDPYDYQAAEVTMNRADPCEYGITGDDCDASWTKTTPGSRS